MFLIYEAIHSVAMEHPQACTCKVCRAAHGDSEAMAEVAEELLAERDTRR
jgi:transcriptional regulatory protein LevR